MTASSAPSVATDPANPATWPDPRFLAAFLDSTLPAAGFDHRGHLRAAWLLLQRHPLPEAITLTCDGIARLARHLGVPDKYHRTITEALVRLLAHAGAATTGQDFATFLQRHPALSQDARGLLDRHYSPKRLASEAARQSFVRPDRLPLP